MKELIVYTEPNCEDCLIITTYLSNNNIPFREIEMDEKEKGENTWVEKIPTVVFEQDGFVDSYIEGYDPSSLVKIINKFRTKKCGKCKGRK